MVGRCFQPALGSAEAPEPHTGLGPSGSIAIADVWIKPGKVMPPLNRQVLVALKEDPCEAVDVACYTGQPEDEQGSWIGTGNRFYTRQIVAWGEIATISEAGALRRKSEERERNLGFIADNLEYWLRWVEHNREAEGLETVPDTSLIFSHENAPPVWPTVGQLRLWVDVMRGKGASQ